MPARPPVLLIVESRNTLFLRYAESIRAAGVRVEHVPHDQAIAKITLCNPDVVLQMAPAKLATHLWASARRSRSHRLAGACSCSYRRGRQPDGG